jgi:hypothetical protein
MGYVLQYSRLGSSATLDRDDLGRIAVDIDEHAKKIGLNSILSSVFHLTKMEFSYPIEFVLPSRSKDFEDIVERTIGETTSDADRDDPIDPVVSRSTGLEERGKAEVVAGRIDRLAAV